MAPAPRIREAGAAEEEREREQKAAHGIKMKAMAAAEEVQMARPTICSAL